MISIDTTTLPENIQSAIIKFEEKKATYVELQERLNQLHKKLEKHRKSAAATQLQSEQLGTQWREAFRQNDGELTKEIRTIKNSEIEAKDFAEEYAKLVNALLPEFELCQLDTHDAREKYISITKEVRASYTDHTFDTAMSELFSLPQAKLFLTAVKTKFEIIENAVLADQRIPTASEKSEIQRLQADLLRNAISGLLGRVTDEDAKAAGISHFSVGHSTSEELIEVSVLAKARKRNELKAMLN